MFYACPPKVELYRRQACPPQMSIVGGRFAIFCMGDKMTTREEELIERLMRENEEFLKTKQSHSQLSKQLEELEKKPFLTPQDEMEIKIIKKKKLALKDQMEKILVQYR